MDELSHAVEMTHAGTGEEKEMLQEIVRFGDKTAQEIMTARTDLTDVDIHIDFSSLLRVVVETGYSRIPVYDGSQDNIKGIIYIKDLLPLFPGAMILTGGTFCVLLISFPKIR